MLRAWRNRNRAREPRRDEAVGDLAGEAGRLDDSRAARAGRCATARRSGSSRARIRVRPGRRRTGPSFRRSCAAAAARAAPARPPSSPSSREIRVEPTLPTWKIYWASRARLGRRRRARTSRPCRISRGGTEDALVEEARRAIILLAHAQQATRSVAGSSSKGEPFGRLAEIGSITLRFLAEKKTAAGSCEPAACPSSIRQVQASSACLAGSVFGGFLGRAPRRSLLGGGFGRLRRPLGRLSAGSGSDLARLERPRSRSSMKPATSFSNISAITSTPCACSSASSGERATLTWIVTDTSGWSAIFTSWTPIALIGRSSTIWFLATLWPCGFQRLGEVAGGDRAVELAGVRGLADQLDLGAVDLLRVRLGVAAALGIARLDLLAIGLEDLAVGVVGAQRLAARQAGSCGHSRSSPSPRRRWCRASRSSRAG